MLPGGTSLKVPTILQQLREMLNKIVRHISITPEVMKAINKSESNAVKLPDGNYLGATEVFHQLHCLNLIRQHSYREYYDVDGRRPPGLTDSPTTLRNHLGEILLIMFWYREKLTQVDHCIDILRQNIMCNGDISVITHNWVEGYQFPYPNFSMYYLSKKMFAVLTTRQRYKAQVPKVRQNCAVGEETPG